MGRKRHGQHFPGGVVNIRKIFLPPKISHVQAATETKIIELIEMEGLND
jgi:hypothetical protein